MQAQQVQALQGTAVEQAFEVQVEDLAHGARQLLQSRNAFARPAIGGDDVAQGIEGDEDFRCATNGGCGAPASTQARPSHSEIAVLDRWRFDDAVTRFWLSVHRSSVSPRHRGHRSARRR
jgi:hypothetical protein